tara:strand:+ start:604 stop:1917 length:1314 start_codon:yes stop_codon:yes gene_type:complete
MDSIDKSKNEFQLNNKKQNLLSLFQSYSSFFILAAIILSFVSGFSGNAVIINIATICGELFIKFLKLISIPILFLAIITSFINMQEMKNIQWVSKKIFQYTVFTTIIAATIACILYLSINPLHGIIPKTITGAAITNNANYLSTFLNMFPDNIFNAFANNNVLGIALIALVIGAAFKVLPKHEADAIKYLFSGFFTIFKTLASYAITLLPIGIWCFGTILINNLLTNAIEFSLIKNFVLCLVLANLIQGLIIIPALLYSKKISPLKFFKQVLPALSTAFFSKSSSTALPLTIKSLSNNDKEAEKFFNFSVPLCTIINMNGCAAFIYTAVIFNASYYGMHFSMIDMILWIFIATCVAIGNASVPMGCYFLSSALLAGMGIPLKLMALILPVYAVIDMIETALNVWSDCSVTRIVKDEWDALHENTPNHITSSTTKQSY